jgi:NAD(P)H-dependent FMN reductase
MVQLSPEGCTIDIASIADIPLYDGDVEAQAGIPAAVTALKERIVASDGVLLVTPEYNNSMPGVLKNAIDWLSRPPADIPKVFGDRPFAIVGATPGRGGTRLSQAAWLPVLRTLGTRAFFGKSIYLDGADKALSNGSITDERTIKLVRGFLDGFCAFVGR